MLEQGHKQDEGDRHVGLATFPQHNQGLHGGDRMQIDEQGMLKQGHKQDEREQHVGLAALPQCLQGLHSASRVTGGRLVSGRMLG